MSTSVAAATLRRDETLFIVSNCVLKPALDAIGSTRYSSRGGCVLLAGLAITDVANTVVSRRTVNSKVLGCAVSSRLVTVSGLLVSKLSICRITSPGRIPAAAAAPPATTSRTRTPGRVAKSNNESLSLAPTVRPKSICRGIAVASVKLTSSAESVSSGMS